MTLQLHIILTTDKNGTKAVVGCASGCEALAVKHTLLERVKTFGKPVDAEHWARAEARPWIEASPVPVRVRLWRDGKEEQQKVVAL